MAAAESITIAKITETHPAPADHQLTPRIEYLLTSDFARVAVLDTRRVAAFETLTQAFLSEEEQRDFAALRHPQRRREWLGARICLKSMLQDQGWISSALDCEVQKDQRGRPHLVATSQSETNVRLLPDISLAHTAHWACAGVTERNNTERAAAVRIGPAVRIGIDMEAVSGRATRLQAMFVGGQEIACRTDRSPDEQHAIWWTLKEAYSKTVGLGLGLGLTEIVCHETAEGAHHVAAPGGPAARAWHVVQEGYVLALCETVRT